MDKFKAFLSDKKNTPIVGAVAAIILVLVVLFFLKATPDMSQTGSQETAPPDMSQGSTGSTTTAQASAAPLAVGKIPPMLAYRKDPFMGYSGPPKKEDALIAMLPIIGHIRLAPASLSPPPGQAVAEEACRRYHVGDDRQGYSRKWRKDNHRQTRRCHPRRASPSREHRAERSHADHTRHEASDEYTCESGRGSGSTGPESLG
jgi:hypothetical protein